jgi:hypothetical protein
MIDHESREAPPGVTRIDMQHGAYVTREAKTTGAPGWLLRTKDGTAVRGLNEFESEFIDSALRAAGDAQQGGGKLPQLPETDYNGYSDGSEPLYTGEMMREYARAALAQRAASVPAQGSMVIGFTDPEAVFAQFCEREGYPSDGDMDEALRKAFYEGSKLGYPAASVQPFQQRVQPWMLECFGAEISADKRERNHRFFEESTELVQAGGMTASEAHQLVDYVYGRPVGELAQEVGGVMVTLAALCLAQGMDMHAAGETELTRIWTKVEAIRAKQAAKPKHSPLPQAVQPDIWRDAALSESLDHFALLVARAGATPEGIAALKAVERALADQAAPEVASVPDAVMAWATEDGERVVPARTMEGAKRDGGAILTSMKPYVLPLYTRPQPAPAVLLEQAAQVCDQQADGTNGPYRSACLQCADAVRELRDATIGASAPSSITTNQEE